MNKILKINANRADIIKMSIYALFSIVLIRLFQIQVINSSRYKSLAREQHWITNVIQAKRGDIYTSDGHPVALSIDRYYIRIDFAHVEDKWNLMKKLEEVYTKDELDMIRTQIKDDTKELRITYPLNWEKKNLLVQQRIPGVYFENNYSRYYPEGQMLSHVLGFVAKNKSGENTGYYGIEQYYDGYLKGQDGWSLIEKAASGDPILWGGTEKYEAKNGSDLYLTINRNIQFIVEKHLKEGVERYNAKSGVVVVVNPKTGEIISMAKFPGFDPLMERKELDLVAIRNDNIASIYEPGSVIKPLTMAAALDLGKVNPSTTINDTGPKQYSDYKIDNWDGKHHGVINMTQVLQLSNNIGIAWVGVQVGSDQLLKYFKEFKIAETTSIDLEGEEKGIIYTHINLKDIELANASFGQGISATPLQVAMSYAAIANDGKLMKPYIVSKIVSDRKEIVTKPEILSRPISENTAKTMVDILTSTVSGGEAKYFVSKKYYIAGKTGTAQVPIKGGYDKYRTNATFVGFFPAYKNFVMLVRLEEPTNPSGYAAETAVPLWMRIAEDVADYYGLNPDRFENKN